MTDDFRAGFAAGFEHGIRRATLTIALALAESVSDDRPEVQENDAQLSMF